MATDTDRLLVLMELKLVFAMREILVLSRKLNLQFEINLNVPASTAAYNMDKSF